MQILISSDRSSKTVTFCQDWEIVSNGEGHQMELHIRFTFAGSCSEPLYTTRQRREKQGQPRELQDSTDPRQIWVLINSLVGNKQIFYLYFFFFPGQEISNILQEESQPLCHQKSNFPSKLYSGGPLIFSHAGVHICPTFPGIYFLWDLQKCPACDEKWWHSIKTGCILSACKFHTFVCRRHRPRRLYSTFQQVRHPLGAAWCARPPHILWLGLSRGGSAARWSSEYTGSPPRPLSVASSLSPSC